MATRRSVFAWLGVFAILPTAGCKQSNEKFSVKTTMPQSIYIEIGESPQALISRYGNAVEVNDKNSNTYGVSFYSIDWPSDDQGSVIVKNGAGDFRLDTVLGLFGAFDRAKPNEGFYAYNISLGIPPRNGVLHNHARLKFYEILARIQKAGWNRLIYQTEPRLKGAEALRYQQESGSSVGSLDPEFIVSLEDWMQLKDRTPWMFYKNGVYMDVRLSRDPERMKIEEPGAYFISISLKSYASHGRTIFDEKDRARWRELLPEERKRELAERAEAEKRLEAGGYHIDSSYRNPDEEMYLANPPLPSPLPPSR